MYTHSLTLTHTQLLSAICQRCRRPVQAVMPSGTKRVCRSLPSSLQRLSPGASRLRSLISSDASHRQRQACTGPRHQRPRDDTVVAEYVLWCMREYPGVGKTISIARILYYLLIHHDRKERCSPTGMFHPISEAAASQDHERGGRSASTR